MHRRHLSMRDAATILSIGAVSGLAAAYLIYIAPISTCAIVLSMIGLLVFQAKRTAMRREEQRPNAVVRLRPVGEQRPAPYLSPAFEERKAAAPVSQLYYGDSNSYDCSIQPGTDLRSPTRAAVQPMTTSYSTLPSAHDPATRPPPPPSYFDQDAHVAHAAATSHGAVPRRGGEPRWGLAAPIAAATLAAFATSSIAFALAAATLAAALATSTIASAARAASAFPASVRAPSEPATTIAAAAEPAAFTTATLAAALASTPEPSTLASSTLTTTLAADSEPATFASTSVTPNTTLRFGGASASTTAAPPTAAPPTAAATAATAAQQTPSRFPADGDDAHSIRGLGRMRASLTTTALAAPFTTWGGKAGWVSAFGGGGLGGSEWPLMRASAERAPKRKAILLRILDMYPNASSPVGSRLPDDASQHRIVDDRQVKLELSISPPKHAPHTAQRLCARDDARDDHVCGAARVERAVLSVPHSARQRQHERRAWDHPNAETAKAELEVENFYKSVSREMLAACAAGRGVGEKLKEADSILQEVQKVRDAARTKEEQEARKAREKEEALRAAQEKKLMAAQEKARLEAVQKAREEAEARKAADEQAKAVEAAKKAPAAVSAPAPAPAPASGPARPGALAAPAPAGPGAISGQTSKAGLLAEWEGSKRIAQQDENNSKNYAKQPQSIKAKMLVGQVVCVHFNVWERAELVLRELASASQTGPEGERAVCATIATQVIDTCATMVDKQPGMAYALSGFVLHVGGRCPVLWDCLLARLQASCCYCVPYYPDNTTGNMDEFKKRLGYKQNETKKEYYARMAGYVTLYAALLQQSSIAQFPPQSAGNANFDWGRAAKMPPFSVPGGFAPKGVLPMALSPMARAWAWLARLLNNPPGKITATILLAFLKPCAHVLHATYPTQFPKLLTFLQTKYLDKICVMVSGQGSPAEESAALENLKSWLTDTNVLLAKGGRFPEPKEADMPEYKPPDDLRDARDANGGDF
jgi:hypothetical protein